MSLLVELRILQVQRVREAHVKLGLEAKLYTVWC